MMVHKYKVRRYGGRQGASNAMHATKVCLRQQPRIFFSQNEALLLQNLHKADIPWVHLVWKKYYHGFLPSGKKKGSFWWREILKLLDSFKGMALLSVFRMAQLIFFGKIFGKYGP
jgi:hypothetical protein